MSSWTFRHLPLNNNNQFLPVISMFEILACACCNKNPPHSTPVKKECYYNKQKKTTISIQIVVLLAPPAGIEPTTSP